MKIRFSIVIMILLAAAGAIAPLSAAPAQPSGTLRISIIGDVTLNPFTFPQQLPTQMVASVIYGKLTRYRPGDMQPVGDLATSWVPAEDGRVWVFKLRRGVRWHDGAPFTARDVQFTLENVVNPDVKALYRSVLKGLRRVDVVDDYTVRLEFTDPFPTLPTAVGWWIIPMAPRHLLAGKDLNDLSDFVQRPIGTGPFVWKEAVKGSHVLGEANPDYWAGAPKLKNVVFKVIPDINTVMAQLRAGELDLAQVEAVHMEALQGVPHLTFRITEQPSTFYLYMNNTRWPFNDRNVRLALMYGLNRELIARQILKGTAPVATHPWARAFGSFYNDTLKPHPYDPTRAREFLAQAGFRPGPDGVLQKDGRRLAFEIMVDRGNPVREQITLFAQQSWKQLGADVRLAAEEWSVYIRRGNSQPGDYDVRTGWRITSPDPDKTAEFTTGGANNHYGYSNPEVDRLMAQARETLDKQTRIALYHRIQEIVYRDVPAVWINYRTEILAMNKRVNDYPKLMFEDALFWMHLPRVE